MSKRTRKRSVNMGALSQAAKRAARSMRPQLNGLALFNPPPLEFSPRTVKRSSVLRAIPPVLEPPPRQLPIQRNVVRAATVKALAKAPSVRAKKDVKGMSEELRRAICDDYKRDRAKRRESMFAKGSAGKGSRNNQKQRRLDWRAEACK